MLQIRFRLDRGFRRLYDLRTNPRRQWQPIRGADAERILMLGIAEFVIPETPADNNNERPTLCPPTCSLPR